MSQVFEKHGDGILFNGRGRSSYPWLPPFEQQEKEDL
jgi:hypothetical protein